MQKDIVGEADQPIARRIQGKMKCVLTVRN